MHPDDIEQVIIPSWPSTFFPLVNDDFYSDRIESEKYRRPNDNTPDFIFEAYRLAYASDEKRNGANYQVIEIFLTLSSVIIVARSTYSIGQKTVNEVRTFRNLPSIYEHLGFTDLAKDAYTQAVIMPYITVA